jgi:hypothetical protein
LVEGIVLSKRENRNKRGTEEVYLRADMKNVRGEKRK